MAFSDQERDIARQIKEQGGTREDFLDVLGQIRTKQATVEVKEETIVEETPETTTIVGTDETTVAGSGKLRDIGAVAGDIAEKLPLSGLTTGLAEGAETFISEPLTKVAEAGKEAGEFFTTEATGEEGFFEFQKNVILNIVPSLGVQGSELIDTVANPVDTASGLLNLGEGIAGKLVFSILDTVTGQDKRTVSAQTEMVDAVAREIKEKYGTPTKFSKAFQENPALLLEIGFSAIKKGGRLKLSASDKKKIADLEKEANAQIKEFLKPTKNLTKDITKKISPELIDRIRKGEIKPGDRQGILDFANSKVEEVGKDIGNFIKEGKVKGEIDFDGMIDVLAKEDAKLRIDGEILPGNELSVNFINKQLDFLGQLQAKYGKSIPTDKQVELRRLYDVVFDKGITRDKITKFQDDLQVKLADNLRKELAKNNPDLAELNKNFTFYKGLETVLDETVTRTQGHDPVGLISEIRKQSSSTSGAIIGGALGSTTGPIGTVVGATLGGAIGAKITRVTGSPKYKLISAKKKTELADAIAKGDAGKLEKLLDTLIISEGIKDFNEQQLPSTRQIIS